MAGSSSASDALFATACKRMPGGVSSPVRAFGSVGGTPRYMARGMGAQIWDEDGNAYTDYCLAWGPLILGHAHPAVLEAVTKTARDGLAFGTCHRMEVALAELVLEAFAPAERVRFLVTGTEAVMTALRLARAHTKRRLILKFSGCYHGHSDGMLVKAGSGVATLGIGDSEGVSAAQAAETIVVPLGSQSGIEEAFARYGTEIAAVILEPLPANNGLLLQDPAWLQALQKLARASGALLICDEVITGFRFGFHGYARMVGLAPDLTTLGKVLGGGLPVSAVLGRAEILDRLAPAGKTYQAGTMSGNPVALAAGIATLTELRTGEPYHRMEGLGARLEAKLRGEGAFAFVRVGSVFWPYFGKRAPTRAEDVSELAVQEFQARYHRWLDRGIYLSPSAWEVGFLSSMHQESQVDALAEALLEPRR